ncbi:MAG: DHHA1 domain-containing protein [Euryarchaeota archaeon]|nr:DHHA1 domain-containing protein [Euryarchaeota archaeon]
MKNYLHDPYTTEFEAEVVDIIDNGILLDNTYFHPEGGGQPADRGAINEIPVRDVQETKEEVIHYLSPEGFEAGQHVQCKINEKFRRYCMRSHTGAHILFGAGRKLLNDVRYAGFGIGKTSTRIDFGTETAVDDDLLLQLEYLSNKVVLEGREILNYFSDEVDDERLKTLVYAKEKPAGRMRVVEIEDWDLAACSGTHFTNTREIGLITVLGKSKLQEGVTRIEFTVGEHALDSYMNTKKELHEAASLLHTSTDDISQKITNLFERLDAGKKEKKELKERLVSQEIERLQPVNIEDYQLYIGKISRNDPNNLGILSKRMAETKEKSIAVLISENHEKITLAASCTVDVPINLSDTLKDVVKELGGGGGGGPRFFQAGGITVSYTATKKEIEEAFLRTL